MDEYFDCARADLRLCLMRAARDGELQLLVHLMKEPDFSNSMLFVFQELHPRSTPSTPIAKAARQGHVAIVEELIPYYKKVGNLRSGYPLHHACAEDRTDTVRLLVKNFPQFVNVPGCYDIDPIQIAASRCSAPVVQILVDAGARVVQRSSSRVLSVKDVRGKPERRQPSSLFSNRITRRVSRSPQLATNGFPLCLRLLYE